MSPRSPTRPVEIPHPDLVPARAAVDHPSMHSLKQSSKPARIPLVLLAAFLTILAVIAVRPAAGLAAPVSEPQLSFEPGSYDFGLQPIYNTAQANLELRNEGVEEVWIESLQTSGPGSARSGSATATAGAAPSSPANPARSKSTSTPTNRLPNTAPRSMPARTATTSTPISAAPAPAPTSAPIPTRSTSVRPRSAARAARARSRSSTPATGPAACSSR